MENEVKNKFGYTDPRDIEWAERTSRTSKSGLPYGTSPSQRDMWNKCNSDKDKEALGKFGLFFAVMAFIFTFIAPFLLGGK